MSPMGMCYGKKAAKKLGMPLKDIKKMKPKKHGNMAKYVKKHMDESE